MDKNSMTQDCEELSDRLQRMQEHLIYSEKMVSLGSLVAGVTHEVSTPIGLGVTGMSHFLHQTKKLKELYDKEEMTQEDFENYLLEAEKTADIVYTNLITATNLIKSFKKISVDQSSKQSYEFNLKEYVDEIIISLHSKLKHTNITVVNEMDPTLMLNSYPGSFAQIFTNFIMNSLIHAFKDDEVGEIVISATGNDKNIVINYKDNGCGIDAQYIDKIYEPFFTTKKDEGGSGLGLQIIHYIVTQELAGEISVDSTPNKGVDFKIVIPRELS